MGSSERLSDIVESASPVELDIIKSCGNGREIWGFDAFYGRNEMASACGYRRFDDLLEYIQTRSIIKRATGILLHGQGLDSQQINDLIIALHNVPLIVQVSGHGRQYL